MAETKEIIKVQKKHAVFVICIPILFTLYVCILAFERVPSCRGLIENLGITDSLPFLTRFLLATYQYWLLVPIALGIATAVYTLRRNTKSWHAILLFIIAMVFAFEMYIILNEGTLLPLQKIIELVGNCP